jgi:hypothetical protein
MGVAAAGIMAYPFSAVVDMGCVGMSFAVVEVVVFFGGTRRLDTRRTVRWNILTTATNLRPAAARVLCHG